MIKRIVSDAVASFVDIITIRYNNNTFCEHSNSKYRTIAYDKILLNLKNSLLIKRMRNSQTILNSD